ncbi:39S ribosomal protein L42, mitochondrial [Neodiprion virginianus]|uniref:39S ribosomal protein L42, mitochondrial n=1 Tax=Neodiprion virginianus TaxID=2961670 RepID=UPI001EE748FD|nr:39S ribosomal protein L42, mitochondrial [Neodiprion virginianus]
MMRFCLKGPLLALRSLRCPKLNYSTMPSEAVVIADDGTIVCWHPEQHFPYQYTKPLPAEKIEENSVLSNRAKEAMDVFRKKHPEVVREELTKITFTTKHRWYPRARDKKAKKTPMDREYL